MPRDGSGNYSVPYPDFVPGTIIDQAQIDANFADIATALTQSLARNGEAAPTQDLPLGGRKFTGAADAALPDQYPTVRQIQGGTVTWGGTTTGTGGAYMATLPQSYIGPYSAGLRVQFRVHITNTAAPTLSVSGLTAKPIQWLNRGVLSDLPAGMLVAGSVVEVCYSDATLDKFVLMTPLAFASGFYEVAQSVNASAQAVVNFALPSIFTTFQLRITDTGPDVASVPFLRFSYDNGATYSAASAYGYCYSSTSGGTVNAGSAVATFIGLGEIASSNMSGTIDFSTGNPTRGVFAVTTYKPGPVLNFSSGAFNGLSATATHVQFGFAGQSVAGHRITLLGGGLR